MPTEKKASTKAATAETKSTTAKKTSSSKSSKMATGLTGEDGSRRQMIAEAAYYYAEKRGFQGGDPADDWFRAEQDIQKLFS